VSIVACPAAVTVNFTTAAGGANPATAGSDYATTSGTLNFAANQRIQTISVPILSDADGSETNETFVVNLTGSNLGIIDDNSADGTILTARTQPNVIISELRSSGPSGTADDFVELFNLTNSDITVAASDASAGWGVVAGAGAASLAWVRAGPLAVGDSLAAAALGRAGKVPLITRRTASMMRLASGSAVYS
jgi:hypothetical protein